MHEAYVKIKEKSIYQYRLVDKVFDTINYYYRKNAIKK